MLYDLIYGRTVWLNPSELPHTDWEALLTYVPQRNRAAREVENDEKRLVIQLPPDAGGAKRSIKQRALAASRGKPVSLILQDSSSREVWKLCNGRRTLREIIERYNTSAGLSFHAARISVCQLIKQLSQRGFILLVTDP